MQTAGQLVGGPQVTDDQGSVSVPRSPQLVSGCLPYFN